MWPFKRKSPEITSMTEEKRQQIDNLKAEIIFKPENIDIQAHADVIKIVDTAVNKLLSLVGAETVIQILEILAEKEEHPARMLIAHQHLKASQFLDAIKDKYYSDES